MPIGTYCNKQPIIPEQQEASNTVLQRDNYLPLLPLPKSTKDAQPKSY